MVNHSRYATKDSFSMDISLDPHLTFARMNYVLARRLSRESDQQALIK